MSAVISSLKRSKDSDQIMVNIFPKDIYAHSFHAVAMYMYPLEIKSNSFIVICNEYPQR